MAGPYKGSVEVFMNQFMCLGNLVADPEVRTLPSGEKKVTVFRIAINDEFKKEGKTTWLSCEAWDKTGELIAEHFRKGDPILITNASLKTDQWDDKDGNKRSQTKVTVHRFQFLPFRKDRDDVPAAPSYGAKEEKRGRKPEKVGVGKNSGDRTGDDDEIIPF